MSVSEQSCSRRGAQGYIPANVERQASALTCKRAEYQQLVAQYYRGGAIETADEAQLAMHRQARVPCQFHRLALFVLAASSSSVS